jgi:hypothetical protein
VKELRFKDSENGESKVRISKKLEMPRPVFGGMSGFLGLNDIITPRLMPL